MRLQFPNRQCPCGNPLTWSDHGDRYYRVRYCRPQHPEYREILEEAGVPCYVPTAEELGCSQEALDHSHYSFSAKAR